MAYSWFGADYTVYTAGHVTLILGLWGAFWGCFFDIFVPNREICLDICMKSLFRQRK